MQTFLPYADFAASNHVLDDRRLGKQRVETYQILRALTFPRYAWKNHPAVRMWRGFVPALVTYGLASCDTWSGRGFPDRVRESLLTFTGGREPDFGCLRRTGQLPPWFGRALLHESHQSALVRKDPLHYRPYFPDVPDDLPYLWPSGAFPYWPLRRPGAPVSTPEAALRALGYVQPRAGQAEAVQAIARGRDVLLCMPEGGGATATALMAALIAPSPALWINAHADGTAPPPPDIAAPEQVTPPVERSLRRPVKLTARPPSHEDLEAVHAEVIARIEHLFFRPQDVSSPEVRAQVTASKPGLVVVEGADQLSQIEGAEVAAVRATLAPAPLLALTGPLTTRARDRLVRLLGLRQPVVAAGAV
jgi:hypothetical protein